MRQIPERESLKVEFKGDRKSLSDSDIIAAAVCLANTDGGTIYLGVEPSGEVTGVHPNHSDASALAALIANSTNPPLSVRAQRLEEDGKPVMALEVPRSLRPVATSKGLLQRRRLKADGTPECVPFYPHEFATRQADLGLLDFSSQPIEGSTPGDLDPLERARLRQMIERYRGDGSLLGLADEDLDGALGLVRAVEGRRTPTVAGLLLLGKAEALRERLPTHEVALQILEGTQVRGVNEFHRWPLLRTFEWVLDQFSSRNLGAELEFGLVRIPVPDHDPRAFREAFVNALIHRDYTRTGACHVRWEGQTIVISNPGSFIEGVTLKNLLVVEPRPRNPVLADAVKRIGLAERTGRGVDLIFQGLLRYGRPPPDYGRTDSHSVVVALSGGPADLGFLRVILEEEKRSGAAVSVEALIALSKLRRERRVATREVAEAIQRDEAAARGLLERLVEAGLVEAHGVKKGRTYTLGAEVYRKLGEGAAYVRQAGFSAIRCEGMVLEYAETHGRITRGEALDLCQISGDRASRILRKLLKEGRLRREGVRKGAVYYPVSGA